MWPVNDKSLQQDFGRDFSEAIVLHLQEEMEKQGTEPMGVSIRVPEMQHDRSEKIILS
jgi:hypothetical protein